MIFTDKHLKLCKEDIFGYEIGQLPANQGAIGPNLAKALLARLEAAEAVINQSENAPPSNLRELWRKSAGKD